MCSSVPFKAYAEKRKKKKRGGGKKNDFFLGYGYLLNKIFIRDEEIKSFPSTEELQVSSHVCFVKKLLEDIVHTQRANHAGTCNIQFRREAKEKVSRVMVTRTLEDITKQI